MTTPNRQDLFTDEERQQEASITLKWHAVFKALRETFGDDDIEAIWENGVIITLGDYDEDGDSFRVPPEDVKEAAASSTSLPGKFIYRTTPEDINYDYPGLYDRGE